MILDKSSLINDIETLLRDNGNQEISPQDLRNSLVNIIDSVHVLSADENIESNNFGTPADRNIRLGELALDSIDKPGRSSSDTTALGYKVLESNYDGIRNTGVGSFSMSCSIYGSENVSVGYGSMSGSVDGSYNVSVGNYGLYSNKFGRNNIAIGHGAGYFAPKDDSWKLYVGSYDIESEDVCDEIGSGIQTSLMYGDLLDNKLGVGVVSLDEVGTLQVGGHITPSGESNDIGTDTSPFRNVYVGNSINNKFMIDGYNLNPYSNGVQSLGSEDKRWIGKFTDISVTGSADIETVNYTNITDNTYEDRTLYLASSGNAPVAYLNDSQVEGGGLVLQSSGIDYQRDYHWTFQQPNYDIDCIGDVSEADEDYARATWFSNISVELEEGRHLNTDRVKGRESLSLVKPENCYGVFIKNAEEKTVSGTVSANESQTVSIGATGGTYKLRYKSSPADVVGVLSTTLNYDASANEIEQALESIPEIGTGPPSNVEVTAITSTSYSVEFVEALGSKDIQALEVVDIDLENSSGQECKRNHEHSFDVYGDNGSFAINFDSHGWIEAPQLNSVTTTEAPIETGNFQIPFAVTESEFEEILNSFFGINDAQVTITDHPTYRSFVLSFDLLNPEIVTAPIVYDDLDLDYYDEGATPIIVENSFVVGNLECEDVVIPPTWVVVTDVEGQDSTSSTTYTVPSEDIVYIARESDITPDPMSISGQIGNISNVNMISDEDEYSVTYSMLGSDSRIAQRFRSKTSTTKQADHSLEVSHGFDIIYVDENNLVDNYTSQKRDRLVFSAHDGTVEPLNAITLMKSATGGLLGITDIFDNDVLPETIVNVQSSGVADVRVTGATAASVQLMSGTNKLIDGAELKYILDSEDLVVSRYRDGDKSTLIKIDEDNNFAFDGDSTPEKISVHSGDSNAVIALQESEMVEHTSQWGKFYVKEFNGDGQSQSAYFQDDEGNEFNLIKNKFDQTGNNVYTDEHENTFVGDYSPQNRKVSPQSDRQSNTTLGYRALNGLTTGDGNTAIGSNAGSNITSGSNSVIIGSGMVGTNNDDQFLVGAGGETYLSGEMGDYKSLTLHNGSFTVTSGDEYDRLSFSYDKMNITDLSKEFPNQKFSVIFTGVDDEDDLVSNKLWEFDHSNEPIDVTPSYSGENDVPYAELYGDLKLRGTIRFSDGTSIDSAESLVLDPGTAISIESSGNPTVNVDIDKEDAITVSSNLAETVLVASNNGTHGKLTLDALNNALSSADPRIVSCGGGYNHLFTNDSTFTDVCNTILIGSEAGNLSENWKYSTMIGPSAGKESSVESGANSEHASVFIGYQSGRLSTGCYASTFIGNNAGYSADGSFSSIFIGDEAGQGSSSSRSIGIGDNALEDVIGEKNIEISTGVGGHLSNRLITGTQSNKMSLGDVIGSDMASKRVSVGAARVTGIESTFEVRASTGSEKLQSWINASGVEVAFLDQNGNLHISGSVV